MTELLIDNEIPMYDGKMGVFNFMRKYGFKTSEEMYLTLNHMNEAPKCVFCGKDCDFISFNKGYRDHCNSNECKHNVQLRSIPKNLKTKENQWKNFDKHILSNKNFYKNVSLPYFDTFLKKHIKSIRELKNASYSRLHCLDEKRTCIICKQDFLINNYYRMEKFCQRKSCISFAFNYKKYLDEYDEFSQVPFDIFIENKKKNLISNNDLLTIFTKYGKELTDKFVRGLAIEKNGKILIRKASKDKFSFIYNKIFDDDMYNICKSCGNKYLKFDKVCDLNGRITYKQIGSEFSCGKQKCYFDCIKYYHRTPEMLLKQSKSIKNSILSGKYIPNVTNAWSSSKKKLFFDGHYFRSTWELAFYLYCKNKNIDVMFESIRLKYFDEESQKERIYIVDFYIPSEKLLIEVKPKKFKDVGSTPSKIKALEKYCKKNDKKYLIVDDDWFKINYKKSLLNTLPEDLRKTSERLLKQFEEK